MRDRRGARLRPAGRFRRIAGRLDRWFYGRLRKLRRGTAVRAVAIVSIAIVLA